MTIYIYGSKSFKNNIHSAFEHANMKFRLNDKDSIVELNSLNRLKDAIKENPKNIFLIDEEKIIRKDSLNEKLNLFKAKDRIEEEFLKEFGVMGDLSVDSVSDISTLIIKKLEEEHNKLEKLEEIATNYIKENSNKEYDSFDLDFDEKEDENSLKYVEKKEIELDDMEDDFNFSTEELDSLFDFGDDLSYDSETSKDNNNYKYDNLDLEEDDFGLEVEEIVEQKNKKIVDIEDEDDFNLVIEDIEQIEEKGNSSMENSEFSELDSLSEDDLLEALGGSSVSKSVQKSDKVDTKAEVELNSSSVNDLSALITQLLNNKTLEITIKIKE